MSRSRQILLTGLLIVPVLLTVGCKKSTTTSPSNGSSSSQTSQNKNVKACDLLTAQIAQDVLGQPVKAGATNGSLDTTNGDTSVTQCHYTVASGGISAPQAGLLVRHSGSADQAKQAFENSKGIYHGQSVAGLGDAAYRTQSPPQLDVLKGNNWLIIDAGTIQNPDPAMQEKLAKEVLQKF